MAQLVSPLRRLAIRSDGFVTVESMVEAVLNSNAAGEIRILILEIVETGLLEVICRDAVFDIDYTNDDSAIDFNFSGDNSGVDSTQLFVNLRRVSVNCTNSRSNVDQRSLYRLLAILPNVDTIELVGVGASGQRLQETAEEWTRRGMQLKRLQLDFNRKKSAEEDLEVILKQGCCSKLELLDVWCGPEFLARFWNQELQKSELPFLLTLRSIHLRKNTDTFDEKADGICCFNLTLRQMPKLVDLVIRAKLNDCNFLHGMGCDPDLRRAPIDTIDWSHEKPFLQTLAIGFSLEFCNSYSFRDLRQQIKKRFRFLESFRLLTE
ncbi:hypothetical protein BGZ76_007713 [Entomortierella beljakovae]|nr:hypothetical protein BGZ76_007713 [Entomortierella beljakovae]